MVSIPVPKAYASNSPAGLIPLSTLIAGFWIWKVRNIEEAVEWLKRSPFEAGAEVEIRQIFEMEDFAPVLSEEQIQHKVAKRAELPNQTANK
jgi:hypothetical protein